MNTKSKALSLLSVIIVALVAGSIIFTLQSAKADNSTSSVADDIESTTAPLAVNDSNTVFNGFNGPMMFGLEPRFGFGHRIGLGNLGQGSIQLSSEFTQNVTNIANADSDVQNLLTQGFNITSIRPKISTVIDAKGNLVTKASTADLTLIGNNGSRALVVVDLSQAKVTKIVTLTVTEIDK
jgi:hypothetical protein